MGKPKSQEEFNVKDCLDRLEHYREAGDGDAMLEEISRPWPGMDDDIRIAVQELLAELLHNGKVPLFMKNMNFDDDAESIAVEMPDWFYATSQVFNQRYTDSDEADLRFQKAMAALQYKLMQSPDLIESGYEELLEVLKDWLPSWPVGQTMRTH